MLTYGNLFFTLPTYLPARIPSDGKMIGDVWIQKGT